MSTASETVVGLVPAAGRARRLGRSPGSKEVFPIGFRRDEHGDVRIEVASHHLFRKYARAGATTAYVILRDGKWDIPAYLGDGRFMGVDLAYVVVNESIGTPDTLDRAYPFAANRTVVFGFPDILFGPDDVFAQLLRTLRDKDAELALGLYAVRDVTAMDMVEVDKDGRVRSVLVKPAASDLTYGWLCAAWRPAFTQFMHAFVARTREQRASERMPVREIDAEPDLPMGAVIQGAVEAGSRVYGLAFPEEDFVDIGVPDRLAATLRAASITDQI